MNRTPAGRKKWLALAAINLMVLVGGILALTSMGNTQALRAKKQWLAEHTGIDFFLPESATENHALVDALFHVLAYGLLTLTLLSFLHVIKPSPRHVYFVAAIVLVLGAADEYMQAGIPGREASVLDFFCDVLGLLWGVIFFLFFDRVPHISLAWRRLFKRG